MYHSLDKRIWFTIIFLPLIKSLTLFQIWVFSIIPSLFLSQLELSRIELSKLTPSILMKNCGHFILFWLINSIFICSGVGLASEKLISEQDASSYRFKIPCILLRQIIYLKKTVALSVKFTILISWSPIFIPLILVNEIGKYLSCNV